MARRKKGDPINGWVVLDKRSGHDLDAGRRRRAPDLQRAEGRPRRHARSAGDRHPADRAGRGDEDGAVSPSTARRPTASPCAGAHETNTDDSEGEVIATSDIRPTRGEIEALLPRFIGDVMQTPPQFSAIKIDGNRAYDLAREGETVALEPRPVTIDDLALVDMPDADTAMFEAECGRGTYVRVDRPRHGRGAGLPRPCDRAAADARRPVRRGDVGDARGARRAGPIRRRRRRAGAAS